jgi:hypothetical protein
LTKLKEFDAIYDKIKSDQNQIMCCVTLESYQEICNMTKELEVKLVSVPSTLLWVVEGF